MTPESMISLDPGLRGCGVAHWEHGVLKAAAYVRGSKDDADAAAWRIMTSNVRSWVTNRTKIFHFCVEFPQIYVGAKIKGDNNDLLQLAAIVGALVDTLPYHGVTIYRPAAWKGQVKKEIMGPRIEKRLSPTELAAIEPCPSSLRHNTLDGIGIGLKHLKRL